MIKIFRIGKNEWDSFSEYAHKLAFSEHKPKELDRIDYSLLIVKVDENNDRPVGYITVRENDPRSVYWQFGGAFPEAKKSIYVAHGYRAALDFQKKLSDRVVTYIENTNLAMLKLAFSVGFVVVGTRTVFGKIYVDLLNEFKKD